MDGTEEHTSVLRSVGLSRQATRGSGTSRPAGRQSLPTYIRSYIGERVASSLYAYEFAYGMYVASTLLILGSIMIRV